MITLPSKSALNFSSCLRLNVLFSECSLFSWAKQEKGLENMLMKRSVNLIMTKGRQFDKLNYWKVTLYIRNIGNFIWILALSLFPHCLIKLQN